MNKEIKRLENGDFEVVVASTKLQLEEFKESTIWNDIVNELSIWSDMANKEQNMIVPEAETNNPSTASVLLHMGDLNGRKKAINFFLQLPDRFIDIIDSKIEEKENDVRRKQT